MWKGVRGVRKGKEYRFVSDRKGKNVLKGGSVFTYQGVYGKDLYNEGPI